MSKFPFFPSDIFRFRGITGPIVCSVGLYIMFKIPQIS